MVVLKVLIQIVDQITTLKKTKLPATNIFIKKKKLPISTSHA